jgi:hypothetical protein
MIYLAASLVALYVAAFALTVVPQKRRVEIEYRLLHPSEPPVSRAMLDHLEQIGVEERYRPMYVDAWRVHRIATVAKARANVDRN